MPNTSEIHNLEIRSYTTVRLEGLASCGYIWEYVIDKDDIVELSHIFDNTEKYDIMSIGASPDEIFKITGIGLGTAVIKFMQSRPWLDDDVPYATHVVTVTVV